MEVKQSITINIINFNLSNCPKYLFFKMIEKNRNEVLTDKFSTIFFELKKINKKSQ